jgi:hypothetical protein
MEPPEVKQDFFGSQSAPLYFLLVVALIVSHMLVGWIWYGHGKDVVMERAEAQERKAENNAVYLVEENTRNFRQQAVSRGFGEWTVDKMGNVRFEWKEKH